MVTTWSLPGDYMVPAGERGVGLKCESRGRGAGERLGAKPVVARFRCALCALAAAILLARRIICNSIRA